MQYFLSVLWSLCCRRCCVQRWSCSVLATRVGRCSRCLGFPKEFFADYDLCEECEEELIELSDDLRGVALHEAWELR